MLKRTLVAAVAVLVIVVGAAIPSLALTTQSWEQRRIATELYDTALADAAKAEASSASAVTQLSSAMTDAAASVAAADTIAAKAPGFFDAALVAAVAPLAAAVTSAMPDEKPSPQIAPVAERPEATAGLHEAAGALSDWAAETRDTVAQQDEVAATLADASDALDAAIVAIAATVEQQAAAALGVAPLATADARTAVETARDALVNTTKAGDDPLAGIEAFIAKVTELRASQAAGQAAADAAAAEANSGSGFVPPNLSDVLANVPKTCVGPPGQQVCF